MTNRFRIDRYLVPTRGNEEPRFSCVEGRFDSEEEAVAEHDRLFLEAHGAFNLFVAKNREEPAYDFSYQIEEC